MLLLIFLPTPLLITLLLKSTQTILPFAHWFFPLSSRSDLKCMTKTEKTVYEGGVVCVFVLKVKNLTLEKKSVA